MSEIVICDETLNFLCWREPPHSFYVREKSGNERVIELIPALPDGAPELFSVNSDSDRVNPDPAKIQSCLLLPPPPYLGPNEGLDGWQKIYVETQNVRRPFLTADDDEPLQKALDNYKTNQRRVYEGKLRVAQRVADPEERAQAIAGLQLMYEAPLHHIKDSYKLEFEDAQRIEDPKQRAQTIEDLRVKHEGPNYLAADPTPFLEDQQAAGIFNQNLEMVKAGALGIRDNYLARQWSQLEGVDLEEMARHRLEFFNWLWKNVGRKIRGACGQKFVPMLRVLKDPRFLECCARVRFRSEFEDGTALYLTDYRRATPTKEEIRALQKLLPIKDSSGKGSWKRRRQRSVAGKKKAQIQNPGDIETIMRAIRDRTIAEGMTVRAAIKEVAEIIRDGRSCWDLSQDYDVSPETLRHMYRMRSKGKKK